MKFAYLILAHDAFEQLEKLAVRLLREGPEDEVFIHVDRKSVIPAAFLSQVPERERGRVHVLPQRTAVYWGHHSQCTATLNLLEAALARPLDHYHLLSGRDWPLLPRAAIAAEISRSPRNCYVGIEGEQMGWRMDRFCFEERMLSPRRKPRPFLWRLDALVRKLGEAADALYASLGVERSKPLGPWVKGWQWWSLPRDAADHARDALATLKRSGRLRYTQCSDEHVIPTALFNSAFRDRIRNNRRFTLWAEGEWSPLVLTRAHLAEAQGAGSWFGRKFDSDVDDFFYDL